MSPDEGRHTVLFGKPYHWTQVAGVDDAGLLVKGPWRLVRDPDPQIITFTTLDGRTVSGTAEQIAQMGYEVS